METYAKKCFKSFNSLILETKSWRGLWEHLSLCCVFRHWHLPLCHIWQTPDLICSQKHPRKATGKTRTALFWWARKFIRTKFSSNGYLSPRVFETNQAQCTFAKSKSRAIICWDFCWIWPKPRDPVRVQSYTPGQPAGCSALKLESTFISEN